MSDSNLDSNYIAIFVSGSQEQNLKIWTHFIVEYSVFHFNKDINLDSKREETWNE